MLRHLSVGARLHGLVLTVSTTTGVLRHLKIELKRRRKIKAKAKVALLTTQARRLVLRVDGQIPPFGRYSLVIASERTVGMNRTIMVR